MGEKGLYGNYENGLRLVMGIHQEHEKEMRLHWDGDHQLARKRHAGVAKLCGGDAPKLGRCLVFAAGTTRPASSHPNSPMRACESQGQRFYPAVMLLST